MILYLAEASRRFGCTDIFKEPSKFAWSDLYEDHFIVPYHRIVLVTSKRVMLLQVLANHLISVVAHVSYLKCNSTYKLLFCLYSV